ncbi:MAG: flagellar type III secretion system pore protein FliP [Actinomycetota bacterium]|nr:flagellar type III secretion system pore protein FliP [Actinomycetota bacterium]
MTGAATLLSTLPTASTLPSVTVNLQGVAKPSESVVIILVLSLLAVAPSLVIMLTGFVRAVVVLSLTRNALGLSAVPPNQVLAGLALFISLFVMAPTISTIDHVAIQPYMNGRINAVQAYDAGETPLKTWMLSQTRTPELEMFTQVTKEHPAKPQDVSMTALVPAYILSELHSAFIIGFVIFVPFLIIDLVVASVLMSMGMMMLPPTIISLPFKLLLFVLVDGWTLVAHSLLVSYR